MDENVKMKGAWHCYPSVELKKVRIDMVEKVNWKGWRRGSEIPAINRNITDAVSN